MIRLAPLAEPLVGEGEWPAYRDLVKTLFRERRKQMGTLLKKYYDLADDNLLDMERSTGLDPRRRPETLSIEELARLAGWLPRSET